MRADAARCDPSSVPTTVRPSRIGLRLVAHGQEKAAGSSHRRPRPSLRDHILGIALSGAPNGLAALPAVIIASLNAMRRAFALLRIGMARDGEAEDISIHPPHPAVNSS